MDLKIFEHIETIKTIVPSLKLLTRPINAVGDYLFFSHLSFEEAQPRYHFSIYLARKELRTDLEDVLRVLAPLIDAHSELFTLTQMRPTPMEGLFVVYQLDLSIAHSYKKEDAWLEG